MTLTIKTDHKWKQFKYVYEVPAKVLASEFDYHKPEDDISDGYFKYRGHWYHIDQFMRYPENLSIEFRGWSGYASDSYFSGVVIKISDDGETYKVGTYIS